MSNLKPILVLLLALSIGLISFLQIKVEAEPNTIIVPDDFSTIQKAIDNADEGDTIFVKSATYFETLVIDKSVYLIGDNPNTTIIDGNYTQVYNVIEITSNNVKITGFTIQRSGGVKYYERAGIHIEYSNGNNISYNIITDNYGDGIRLEGSSNNLILENNIIENFRSGIAIMDSSHNNTINGNTLTDNFSGIYVSDSDNQNILQNIVKLSGNNGIDIDDSSNNEIFGNIVLDSYNFGMVIYRSSGDTIYQNRLSNNIKGVWLSFSENNKVFRNNMTNNEHGLDIGSSSNNMIFENVISNNDIGVILTSISPINNTIWNNDFVDNTKQALDDASEANVFWDNGSEGNYWSNYNGIDNNCDGIGEAAYIIEENNQDNYPLMEPFNIEIIPDHPSTFPYAAFDLFPEPNSTDVPLNTNISISISRPAPVVNMIITPKVEVKERIDEVIGFNGRYTFILSECLKPSTTYNVTIIFGETSAPDGFSPTNSKTWIFTTEAEPTEPRIPTNKGPLNSDPISGFFYFILNDIAKGAVPLMLIITLTFVSLVLLVKRFRKRIQAGTDE